MVSRFRFHVSSARGRFGDPGDIGDSSDLPRSCLLQQFDHLLVLRPG
jgi:hypothetical protein